MSQVSRGTGLSGFAGGAECELPFMTFLPFRGPMRRALPLIVLALSGCMMQPAAEVTMNRGVAALDGPGLPEAQGFDAAPGRATQLSNAEIAADMLDLQFAMESGRPLPVLSRFEGPITIRLTGAVPPTAPVDLARVVARFRSEAGLDLRVVPATGTANITMEFQPRAELNRAVPTAACFVVPRVTSFAEYRARRGTVETDWSTVVARDRVAIFVPSDTTPQEVRDCLHEEVAQAMGPINDLYRLSDSVFNDDNFHTVLTGFDMLVLRVHYDPALHSGMTKAEVAARLPAVLARLNPAGEHGGVMGDTSATPKAWEAAVETALGQRGGMAARKAASERMMQIAKAQGWRDGRLAFSLFAWGRAHVKGDYAAAIAAFRQARDIYRGLPGGAIQAAHIDAQLAAFAIGDGQPEQALLLVDGALPVAHEAQNAALLATLYLIRAQAYESAGDAAQSRQARLDSLPWARYGFGSEARVRARMGEIAEIASAAGRS